MIARMIPGGQHRGTVDRPLKEGKEAEQLSEQREDAGPECRDQHENSPQSVHHAGDGGQQSNQECDRLAHRLGSKLGEVDGHTERKRYGNQQSDQRGEQGSEYQRKGAELFRHRIPDATGYEVEPKSLNGQLGPAPELPDEEAEEHRDDERRQRQQQLEHPVAVVGALERHTGCAARQLMIRDGGHALILDVLRHGQVTEESREGVTSAG